MITSPGTVAHLTKQHRRSWPPADLRKTLFALAGIALASTAAYCADVPATPAPTAPLQMLDPLVKASPYRDKSVWSYHGKDPLPWSLLKLRDFSSSKIIFRFKGVRPAEP